MQRALSLLVLALWFGAAGAAPPLGLDDARHLLQRTSFAATPWEMARYAALSREQAADRLLSPAHAEAVTPAPGWTRDAFESLRRFRVASPEERQTLQRIRREHGLELRAWWLEEMRR